MEIPTYCRICEPMCGLMASVEDGRLIAVRGDRDHVSSAGFLCRKAQAMVEVTYDPDRIRSPLRRVGGPGEFEPVSWDEATADIGRRLDAIQRQHGAAAFATVIGNPPAAGYATALWYSGFIQALGVRYTYGINAEDASARMAANALLYGSVALLPKPDLWHTDFALIIGANPYVSGGSLISEPRVRDALDAIEARGGRVVVVDPRRSETARRYEHVGVRAGDDPWLLVGLLYVLVKENLVDREFVDDHTTGFDGLAELVEPHAPEVVADRCGVPASVIGELARDFAAAPSALVYGRTGTCRQRFGTLANALQDMLMILTG
ncbi:MAG TPA: molybdopterin-dependent oxidoreductase, partial [Acidimicrobiia bacterium]|nr:molybdopterin-dependent oxidoreductase [Acidimicrobiia bacterium]